MAIGAALPIGKLLSLFIKTLSKPISKRVKQDFSRFESTQRFLVWTGQVSHQVTSRLTIWAAGFSVRSVKPLEDTDALKRGADIFGETFVLFISGALVVVEYSSSQKKTKIKEEKKIQKLSLEKQELERRLAELDGRLKALETVVVDNKKQTSILQRYNTIQKEEKEKTPTVHYRGWGVFNFLWPR